MLMILKLTSFIQRMDSMILSVTVARKNSFCNIYLQARVKMLEEAFIFQKVFINNQNLDLKIF